MELRLVSELLEVAAAAAAEVLAGRGHTRGAGREHLFDGGEGDAALGRADADARTVAWRGERHQKGLAARVREAETARQYPLDLDLDLVSDTKPARLYSRRAARPLVPLHSVQVNTARRRASTWERGQRRPRSDVFSEIEEAETREALVLAQRFGFEVLAGLLVDGSFHTRAVGVELLLGPRADGSERGGVCLSA